MNVERVELHIYGTFMGFPLEDKWKTDLETAHDEAKRMLEIAWVERVVMVVYSGQTSRSEVIIRDREVVNARHL